MMPMPGSEGSQWTRQEEGRKLGRDVLPRQAVVLQNRVGMIRLARDC
jgi:hypothetical protein